MLRLIVRNESFKTKFQTLGNFYPYFRSIIITAHYYAIKTTERPQDCINKCSSMSHIFFSKPLKIAYNYGQYNIFNKSTLLDFF